MCQPATTFAIADFDRDLIAHLPRLRRYALSLTPGRDCADDLVQETAAKALGALQQRYGDLDIGSYPAFRNGRPSVSLVLRGTDEARLGAAAAELLATIRTMNGEAEEFTA